MRLYKMAACIFPILSVFSFVLAAPVAVQEIREACADAVDGGKYAIIGSGKRAEVDVEEEDPLLAQAQQEPSSSDLQSTPSQHQGSSSASNYATGTPPNPSFSSEGEAKSIQPGTLTEIQRTKIQPASSSKSKLISWAPEREVILPSGVKYSEMLPDSGIKPVPPPGEQLTYLDMMAALKSASQSRPKPQPIFRVLGKLKFWRRIPGTAGGVVTE